LWQLSLDTLRLPRGRDKTQDPNRSGEPLDGVLDRNQLGPQIIDLPLVEF
jgi:hypothetical protein